MFSTLVLIEGRSENKSEEEDWASLCGILLARDEKVDNLVNILVSLLVESIFLCPALKKKKGKKKRENKKKKERRKNHTWFNRVGVTFRINFAYEHSFITNTLYFIVITKVSFYLHQRTDTTQSSPSPSFWIQNDRLGLFLFTHTPFLCYFCPPGSTAFSVYFFFFFSICKSRVVKIVHLFLILVPLINFSILTKSIIGIRKVDQSTSDGCHSFLNECA